MNFPVQPTHFGYHLQCTNVRQQPPRTEYNCKETQGFPCGNPIWATPASWFLHMFWYGLLAHGSTIETCQTSRPPRPPRPPRNCVETQAKTSTIASIFVQAEGVVHALRLITGWTVPWSSPSTAGHWGHSGHCGPLGPRASPIQHQNPHKPRLPCRGKSKYVYFYKYIRTYIYIYNYNYIYI